MGCCGSKTAETAPPQPVQAPSNTYPPTTMSVNPGAASIQTPDQPASTLERSGTAKSSSRRPATMHASSSESPTRGNRPAASVYDTGRRGQDSRRVATTVLPKTPVGRSTFVEDTKTLVQLREECPRLRILVIGRANGGKTTILQRFFGTTNAPTVYDQDGNVIHQSAQPKNGCIDNEQIFPSNDAFVIHDAPGFEASSEKELMDVQEFISNRAAGRLKDQVHAIWYCIPTDSTRPLSRAEMSIFENGTGKVPVVAIFTKYDNLILQEFNKLRYQGQVPLQEAKAKAPEKADALFQESGQYIGRLQHTAHPPAKFLKMKNMQHPESKCVELSRQTSLALKNKRLRHLFIAAQQNNIQISVEFGLREFMLKALKDALTSPVSPTTTHDMGKNMLACFRHLNKTHSDARLEHLSSVSSTWAVKGPPSLQVMQIGIGILIVAVSSFGLEETHLAKASHENLGSKHTPPQQEGVINEVSKEFNEGNIKFLLDLQEEGLVKMVIVILKKFVALT